MTSRRQALTPELSIQWAQLAHAFYLEALMTQADWSAGEIAFHGGTSLRLSWNSARYSEDLDFLLSRSVNNLPAVAHRVQQQLREMFRRIDPNFDVEMRDKTKDPERMPVFMISVSHPAYVGTAKIKAEFWRTAPAYLEQYPTQLRTPQISSAHPGAGVPSPAHASIDLLSVSSNPVPAATLETAYADKLVAFATRPHLKWRDLYDLWWIGTQTPAQLDVDAVCEQFLHNITAYTPLQGLPPHQALSLFLQRPVPEIIRQADPDLRNWLPARLWQRLQGQGVQQMVDYVRQSIAYVSAYLDGQDDERLQGVDLKTLSRRQEPGMRP